MSSKTLAQGPLHTLNPGQWTRLSMTYLLLPLTLLISAWDPGWWQGWIYSLLFALTGIGGHVLAEWRHPGLLAERINFEKVQDVKPWDRLLAPLTGLSTSALLFIVAGLDHHFGWSPMFRIWLNIMGFIVSAAGYAFGVWASAENRFFSSMVRIQTDRGHVVCDGGPYRVVRHPAYAGLVLTLPGIVLALSSLWTIIPAALALITIVTRTALEDRTLQDGLPGYSDYARRVRYRLIPRIY